MAADLLNQFAKECFRQSAEKGFWDEERNQGEMLALIHSEVSEVLEAIRHDDPESEKIAPFSSVEEELADIIIRVCDFAGGFNYDLDGALSAKMIYNRGRSHKHGKAF